MRTCDSCSKTSESVCMTKVITDPLNGSFEIRQLCPTCESIVKDDIHNEFTSAYCENCGQYKITTDPRLIPNDNGDIEPMMCCVLCFRNLQKELSETLIIFAFDGVIAVEPTFEKSFGQRLEGLWPPANVAYSVDAFMTELEYRANDEWLEILWKTDRKSLSEKLEQSGQLMTTFPTFASTSDIADQIIQSLSDGDCGKLIIADSDVQMLDQLELLLLGVPEVQSLIIRTDARIGLIEDQMEDIRSFLELP